MGNRVHFPLTGFVVEREMRRVMAREGLALGRGIGSLGTIAATAPLVGLVGTCLGIVGSFTGCGCEKSSMLAAIVQGLAESLLPLVASLSVAIVALWGHGYLRERLESLRVEMRNGASEVLDILSGLEQRGRMRCPTAYGD